jgi:hypothetical protein
MSLTKPHQEFNYYCLDRLKPLTEELRVTYNDGNVIRKVLYKIGLRADIKHQECFILYTESDSDLDEFLYIDAEDFYNNQRRFFTEILSIAEVKELIKSLKTINIFEFASLLEFTNIYEDFQAFIENNWAVLDMDNLIEI